MVGARTVKHRLIYEVRIVRFLFYFPLQVLLQLCWWRFNLRSLFTCVCMRERDTLNWSEAALWVCTLVVLSRCIACSFLPSALKALNFSLYTQSLQNFHYGLLMCSDEGQVWNSSVLWVVSVAVSARSAFTFHFCYWASIHSTGIVCKPWDSPHIFLLCLFFGTKAEISFSCVAVKNYRMDSNLFFVLIIHLVLCLS